MSAKVDVGGRRGTYRTAPSSSVPAGYESDAGSEIEEEEDNLSSRADEAGDIGNSGPEAEDRTRPSARVRQLRGEESLRELELEW